MASSRPGAYTTAAKRPSAKPFYVLSQYADPDTGELAWCVVDHAPAREAAELSEQQRQDYVDGVAAREEKAATADGRDYTPRHHLFTTVSLAELEEMDLGHLIGR